MSIVLNSYMQSDVVEWRRHLHQHPELLYDVHKTASFLAEKLVAFGCDTVDTGIGQSGLVGIIKGRLGAGPVIGLRSDMDALPILENSGKPWTSKVSGRAHSCGHDGHMAMLLGAARCLPKTRNFRGSVAIIFQPAEEGGGGALAMINDGLMDRFKIEHIFGMHNEPHIPIGQFAIRKGAMLASADTFEITVNGRGGHAGQPHLSVDPVIAAAHIVIGLQSIVSREIDPLQAVVITVASIPHGTTSARVVLFVPRPLPQHRSSCRVVMRFPRLEQVRTGDPWFAHGFENVISTVFAGEQIGAMVRLSVPP